jgi:hypothetical protein
MRLDIIRQHVDLRDKTVLDVGCNTGGMLFHAPEVARGVGMDFDAACIAACRTFQEWLLFAAAYEFHQEDLDGLDVVAWCATRGLRPHVVFALSMGSWVKDWRALYTGCMAVATEAVVLETNNDAEGAAQLAFLREDLGCSVCEISSASLDDTTGNYGRRTFLITRCGL